MKTNSSIGPQLALRETVLLPGGEWAPSPPDWCFVGLIRGLGYWMDGRLNQELVRGALALLPPHARGTLRSSQLAETCCHYCFVAPERLASLLTLAEQKAVEAAGQNGAASVRFFAPAEPIAQGFSELCRRPEAGSLRSRIRMLDLFTQALEPELAVTSNQPAPENGAKKRLEEVLRQMPAADMLELSFAELVDRVGCCPRHAGRLFQQAVGVSFRQKQSQVRLRRARDLLANTDSKVVDVALESGYQSLSLFNLMFKRQFGMSPSQWRRQQRNGGHRRTSFMRS